MPTFDNVNGFEANTTNDFSGAFNGTIVAGNLFGYGNYYGLIDDDVTEFTYFEIGAAQAGAGDQVINQATRYWRCAIQIDLLPASGDEPIVTVSHTAAGIKYELRVTSGGVLKIYDSTLALVGTGTAVLTTGQPYMLEGLISGNGAGAIMTVKVDGVMDIDTTGDGGPSNISRFRFGRTADRNANAVTYRYDHLALATDDYPGIGFSIPFRVTADGTYTAFTVGAGSSTKYENVDDTPSHDGDTSYLLSTGVIGDAYTATMQNCQQAGMPQGATVNVVHVQIVAQRNAASNGTLRTRLRAGGTDTDSSGTQAIAGVYTVARRTHNVDPSDSQPWTQTKINQGVEIGVVEADAAADQCRITQIFATVDFKHSTLKRAVLARF